MGAGEPNARKVPPTFRVSVNCERGLILGPNLLKGGECDNPKLFMLINNGDLVLTLELGCDLFF